MDDLRHQDRPRQLVYRDDTDAEIRYASRGDDMPAAEAHAHMRSVRRMGRLLATGGDGE